MEISESQPTDGAKHGVSATIDAAPPYEQQLDRDLRWALSEGSRHFEEKSKVFAAMHKIAKRLDELGIPYAVVGGMALFTHGLRRFTEDVDLLVTKPDLKKIHQALEGLGYLPVHRYSKNLRDTELGVRIEFLTTGEYPGDGKKKPVAFPDPQAVSFEANGVKFVNLQNLIELKLASGMSNTERLKDLTDVMELIKVLGLPKNFSEQLNQYVRSQYLSLWRQSGKRYVTLWRNKWLTARATTLAEMIEALRAAADQLEAMQKDGVFLENDGGAADDYAHLVTTDPETAKKYDMVEERDYWPEAAEGDYDGEPESDETPESPT
jgi:hypothetical protein